MPAAVGLRPDWEAKRVRAAAREAKDADQARRLLAIAAAYEGVEGGPNSGHSTAANCRLRAPMVPEAKR